MKEHIITGLAIAGITGFFFYDNHQREISKRPAYEGSQAAIARPIRSEDTQYKICRGTKISDGDTITAECDGQVLKIRFCGIDAPEKKQPLGQESKALMTKLIEGRDLIIRPLEKDRYDRTVAEVEAKTDRTDANGAVYDLTNAEMVKAGMAYHYAQYSKNCPNRDRIIDAEKFAKDKKIGVWSGSHQKPWDYRHAKK